MNLLEHNRLNRPLRDNHVRRIAGQIATGKWQFNAETIKIADSGNVLDGQHRLWACIEAKTPIDTLVARGVKEEAFSTIDTLRQMRSGADILALAGVTQYRTTCSTALHWLVRHKRNCIPNYRAPENKVENADIEEAYAHNKGIVRAAERAHSLRNIINAGVAAFLYYVIYNRNPDLAERFIATLANPANVGIDDPFFRLRSHLTAYSYKRKEPEITIALAFKAANAAHRGQQMKTLKWTSQGDKPEDFPKLDIMRPTADA